MGCAATARIHDSAALTAAGGRPQTVMVQTVMARTLTAAALTAAEWPGADCGRERTGSGLRACTTDLVNSSSVSFITHGADCGPARVEAAALSPPNGGRAKGGGGRGGAGHRAAAWCADGVSNRAE